MRSRAFFLLVLSSAFLNFRISCSINPFGHDSDSEHDEDGSVQSAENSDIDIEEDLLNISGGQGSILSGNFESPAIGAPISRVPIRITSGNRNNGLSLLYLNNQGSPDNEDSPIFTVGPNHSFPRMNFPLEPSRNETRINLSQRSRNTVPFPMLNPDQPVLLANNDDDLDTDYGFPFNQLSRTDLPSQQIVDDMNNDIRTIYSFIRDQAQFQDSEIYIRLPQKRGRKDEILRQLAPGQAVRFDTNETEFFEIIRRVFSDVRPLGTRYYGEYIDPVDGSRRFVSLPIFDCIEFYSEDDENGNDADETNDQQMNLVDNSQSNENDVRITPQNSVLQSPTRGQAANNMFITPARTTFGQNIQCPPPPLPDYNSSRYFSPELCSAAFTDPCVEAERIFAERVSRITGVANIHTSFPDQEILFDRIDNFVTSSRLSTEHLFAFEVKFEIFYKLVEKCPQKYFLPALALSLQQDEDFHKFFKIFFGIKTKFSGMNPVEYQSILIDIVLNMKTISGAAFNFFSESRNSMFFFSSFSSHPIYYGKFAPHIVANSISKYKHFNDFNDYPTNLLRYFILRFNYAEIIDLLHVHKNFSKNNFKNIFLLKNLFRDSDQFHRAIYKLFKFATDNTQQSLSSLLSNNKVKEVLKEALKHEDFAMVQVFFENFNLEIKNIKGKLAKLNFRNSPVVVDIKKINSSFCTVKISEKTKQRGITLTLPLF